MTLPVPLSYAYEELVDFPKRLALPHMRDDLGSVIAHRRDRAARKRVAG
ncbi:hypothetical protein AB0D34_22885 [Streptomyces sp. NPDC048420]